MDQSKSMLTIKLKLYKPSLRKRTIIDEAMYDYTRACQFLLDRAEMQIETIQNNCMDSRGKYRASNLVGWIDKQTDKQLNQFKVEPFKDSIKIDVASMLATYLTAKKRETAAEIEAEAIAIARITTATIPGSGKNIEIGASTSRARMEAEGKAKIATTTTTQFPVAYSYEDELEQKYDEIMSEYTDIENIALEYIKDIRRIESSFHLESMAGIPNTGYVNAEDEKRSNCFENRINKLISNTGKLRPIFFCRYATNRNFSILYNPETKKYYAKIYLMNVKNEKRTISAPMPEKVLFYIDQEKGIFNERMGKKSYVLFPLSFGKWQEKYLQAAVLKPEMLKTARLTKTGKDYFLSINIALEKPDLLETKNYMGISRGISNLVNYSVVDNNGDSLLYGNIKAAEENLEINRIHVIANSLIEIAKENSCKVILEKLFDRNDGLGFIDKDGKLHPPAMDYKNYNKLCDIIDYKMAGTGLPDPIRVSGINLFCTCTNCGTTAKANRFSTELLICTRCGRTMEVEKAGSEILAKKILKYNGDKIKVHVDNSDGKITFVNKELEFEFNPENPYDCTEQFKESLSKLIKDFYFDINKENEQPNFKKKYSLIKKLESASDILSMIELE
jgi:putative transposase